MELQREVVSYPVYHSTGFLDDLSGLMTEIKCVKAELTNEAQAKDVMEMWLCYCRDEQGGAEDPSDYAKENLINELLKRGDSMPVFLAYDDATSVVCGIGICIESFSTFACNSILNVHDFCVKVEYRRKGVGMKLMATIEDYCREKGFPKMTLECLEKNMPARNAYIKHGFKPYELKPEYGPALFFQKVL